MLKTPPLAQVSTKERSEIEEWLGRDWGITSRTVRNYRLDKLMRSKPDKFLTEMKAVAVGKVSARGNALYRSRYMVQWAAVPGFTYWLRYTDPSTGQVYVSGVPYGKKVKGNGRDLRQWEDEWMYDYIRTYEWVNAAAPRGSAYKVGRTKRQLWDCTTADGCMAWKYGITLEQYLGLQQEA